MRHYRILKLIGLALLTMITLVFISILEVAIYSYVINPGHEASVYEAHAETTAPYISAISGFIIFFFVARYWTKHQYPDLVQLIILFPVVYIVLDIAVISLAAMGKWSDYILIFVIANCAKFLGSLLGYMLTRKFKIENSASN